jgi:hypothetical protein
MRINQLTEDIIAKLPQGNIKGMRLDFDRRNNYFSSIYKENESDITTLFQINLDSKELKSRGSKLPQINGLTIGFQQFIVGENELYFLFLTCRQDFFIKNYIDIIVQIFEEFEKSDEEIDESAIKVIELWKYFLGDIKKDKLSNEQIIGVFGELVLLERLIHEIGTNSINNWKANSDNDKTIDFVFDKTSIEVKTTQKPISQHVIHGIDQLKINANQTKIILSLKVQITNNDNDSSLYSAIRKITELLKSDIEHLRLFLENLKKLGYDKSEDQYYESIKIRLISGNFYIIDKDFPKLTSTELIKPLDPRIKNVNYEINLEGLNCTDFEEANLLNLIECSI